ncbi:amidase [Arthrobacter pigmenti]
MTDDVVARSITEVSLLIKNRELSPVELTRMVLDRVQAYDDTLRSYISVYDDGAMRSAKRAETEIVTGEYRGPLHGIPMGVKDNLYVQDRVTTIGSKIHRDFVPAYSATVVEKLKQAGAVLTGKLNLHEYALGTTTDNPYFGTCRNPWNLDKSPGGSSGGAGAAVAGGLATAALGSDTSGSIRIPAAACGVVGLKPTYGRVSKHGCFPEAWSLDHVGPMTRTVADSAMVLDAISGYDGNDPSSLKLPATDTWCHLSSDIAGTVIGIDEKFFFRDVDDAIAASTLDAIAVLESLGASVRRVDIAGLNRAEEALTVIDTAETSTVHHPNLCDRPGDYGSDVRLLLKRGHRPSAVEYLLSQEVRGQLSKAFEEVFHDVDVMISPTLPMRTPAIGEQEIDVNGRTVDASDSSMRLVGVANLLGLPALSVPCGVLDGMPIGMQMVGPARGEQKVLDLGHAYEYNRPIGGLIPTAYLPE